MMAGLIPPLVYALQVFKQVFRSRKDQIPQDIAKLPPLAALKVSIRQAQCAALLATPFEWFQLLFRGHSLRVPLLLPP
jgi:hypothetical protein